MANQDQLNMKQQMQNLPTFAKFKGYKIHVKNWKYFVNFGNKWNNPEQIHAEKFHKHYHAVNKK